MSAMTEQEIESLATRRSRRSTAGNRMEAALAELAQEDSNKDLDDDNEFVNDKDEEDIFESDFASTDEEANQDDIEAGEKIVQDEEKSARKAARFRLEKRTAAAHAKHKATFNPQAAAPTVVRAQTKPKRRGSHLFLHDDGESRNVPGSAEPRKIGEMRKSRRRHTMLNTSATVSRLKETEEKRASAPKKFKPTTRAFSQSELIARALDNEEGNISEHRNYLKVEEEKRKKARVIKMPAVEGPLLRWVSKIEEEKYKVNVEVKQPPAAPLPTTPFPYANYYGAYTYYLTQMMASSSATNTPVTATTSTRNTTTTQTSTQSTSANLALPSNAVSNPDPRTDTEKASLASVSATSASTSNAVPTSTPVTTLPISTTPVLQTGQSFSTFRLPGVSSPAYPSFSYYIPTSTATTNSPTSTLPTYSFNPITAPAERQYVEEERIAKVTKNYLVHELGQEDGITKPPWKEMMKTLFGDHVKWEDLKVLSGKGRPLGRVKQKCPITGQTAPYLDPRTGVPFADIEAYRILSQLLDHGFSWSPELGRYVGSDGEAQAVEP